jgi:hypothetical protein|tara:strand:+ start:76 stop:741 length:666 start_codon:yes stop_codon:yes gene_type:complete
MLQTFRKHLKDVRPDEIDSYIDKAFGLTRDDYEVLCDKSIQSFRIKLGTHLEDGWNDVFTQLGINLIEDTVEPQGFYKRNGKGFKKGDPKPGKVKKNNLVKVGKKKRQIDHYIRFVKDPVTGMWKLYLESKCNLNFDTEKKGASNEKVDKVRDALGSDEGAYFVPVLDTIPQDVIAKYPNSTIYGVRDILNMIGNPFTPEEYFANLKDIKEELIQNIKDGN